MRQCVCVRHGGRSETWSESERMWHCKSRAFVAHPHHPHHHHHTHLYTHVCLKRLAQGSTATTGRDLKSSSRTQQRCVVMEGGGGEAGVLGASLLCMPDSILQQLNGKRRRLCSPSIYPPPLLPPKTPSFYCSPDYHPNVTRVSRLYTVVT